MLFLQIKVYNGDPAMQFSNHLMNLFDVLSQVIM